LKSVIDSRLKFSTWRTMSGWSTSAWRGGAAGGDGGGEEGAGRACGWVGGWAAGALWLPRLEVSLFHRGRHPQTEQEAAGQLTVRIKDRRGKLR
jgi:hypothetical protein